ncbi:MAG: VOC family protein [Thermoanaerobaculales bacterium]
MSDGRSEVGSIGWVDLTIDNAEEIRDFYRAVVGWTTTNVGMGDYNDFCMNTPRDGRAVAGICHARGENADLPSHWLVYLIVADLDKSLNECVTRGGRALTAVRTMGDTGRYCVIEDPAGAVVALFERA